MTFPFPFFIPSSKAPITFVGSATAAANNNNASNSINVSGIGLQQNDVVVVVSTSDTATALDHSGYTSLFVNTGANPTIRVSYKVQTATPDTSITITATGPNGIATVAMAFRGVDTSTPIDQTTTSANGASGQPNAPSITTVTDGAMVIAIGALDDDQITTCTISGAYSTPVFRAAAGAFTAASAMMSYALKASAGAEDPPVFSTDGDDEWRAVTVALRRA